jgi:ABC-2 type transport system permease protein
VAALIPVTHSLDGLRMAMMKGASWAELKAPLVSLLAFAVLLLPLSLWLFARALRRARIEGTLSFY